MATIRRARSSSLSSSNDSYSYTALTHDANGNLTHDGTRAFGYDAANRLRSAGTVALSYDALGRLSRQQASSDWRYVYDGDRIVGFATNGTTISQRFIPGPWTDEVAFNVNAGGNRNMWLQDHLASTVAIADSAGAMPIECDLYYRGR